MTAELVHVPVPGADDLMAMQDDTAVENRALKYAIEEKAS